VRSILVICFLMVILGKNGFGQLHSLAVNFSDVILANMKPGMVYSLKKEKGISFEVVNKAKEKRDVEVVVEIPTENQLKEYYEPIPDVSWISVFPSRFQLEPGESMKCDIVISIPPDKKYANRHFQAMIVAQSAGKPGEWELGLGVNLRVASRIRFSTGKTPQRLMEEYRRKIYEALKLELSPMSLFLKGRLPVGRKVILGKNLDTIQLVNKSSKKYKVSFYLAQKPENFGLVEGYEVLPSEVKVKFKKVKMKSKPKSISDIIIQIEIPDKEEFYGKKFAFVVVGRVLGFDIPIEIFSRVYFKTEEKMKDDKWKN